MEYVKIKKVLEQIKAFREKEAETKARKIKSVQYHTESTEIWGDAGEYLGRWGALTERQKQKPLKEQIKILLKEEIKNINKDYLKELSRVETAEAAEVSPFFEICVDWKASRTWGHNPQAELRTNKNIFESSRVTGCGYDKRSTATADALNASPQVKAALYNLLEKQPQKVIKNILLQHTKHYKTDANQYTDLISRHIFGYGVFAGYYHLPRFEGGVGIGSHISILERLGYKNIIRREPERGADLYYFEYKTTKRG